METLSQALHTKPYSSSGFTTRGSGRLGSPSSHSARLTPPARLPSASRHIMAAAAVPTGLSTGPMPKWTWQQTMVRGVSRLKPHRQVESPQGQFSREPMGPLWELSG